MSDLKDTAIKLFGKTIQLPLNQQHESDSLDYFSSCSRTSRDAVSEVEPGEQEQNRDLSDKENPVDKQEDSASNNVDSKEATICSGVSVTLEIPSVETETSSLSKTADQSETSTSQDKPLKKPDKILPCPRCNSMETKFCYYNNYNVNQPRHFCKNCQRYWTAGGITRNVPVGAGRRKNKSSSINSRYHQLIVLEAIRAARVNAVNRVHGPSIGSNSTVLSFGSDSPLCESVVTVLKLSEKEQNNLHKRLYRSDLNSDDSTSWSSTTDANTLEKQSISAVSEADIENYKGIPPHLLCFSGPICPYRYNSAMPPPTVMPSGLPVSFYPLTNYWRCNMPRPWTIAVQPHLFPRSTSLDRHMQSLNPNSPLGKHSREGELITPANPEESSRESNSLERKVSIPSTLRIDDPSEAANSSIWTTLGINIKSKNSTSVNEGSLFMGYQKKSEDTNYIGEANTVLQTNPAALLRSINFHERST